MFNPISVSIINVCETKACFSFSFVAIIIPIGFCIAVVKYIILHDPYKCLSASQKYYNFDRYAIEGLITPLIATHEPPSKVTVPGKFECRAEDVRSL